SLAALRPPAGGARARRRLVRRAGRVPRGGPRRRGDSRVPNPLLSPAARARVAGGGDPRRARSLLDPLGGGVHERLPAATPGGGLAGALRVRAPPGSRRGVGALRSLRLRRAKRGRPAGSARARGPPLRRSGDSASDTGGTRAARREAGEAGSESH